MNNKNWIVLCIGLTTLTFLGVASFNIFMDPYWSFEHSHKWNNQQVLSDERLIKSNDFLHHGKKFDSVLMGSSVSTYINTARLKNLKTYNYAFSSMQPKEIPKYLDFIKSVNPNVKEVILGLDFHEYFKHEYKTKDPSYYLNKVQDPFFLWKTIISYSQLKDSLENFQRSQKIERRYNRERVASIDLVDKEETLSKIKKSLLLETDKKQTVDPEYEKILRDLTLRKDIRFRVFTTPISGERISFYLENYPVEFENWLNLISDIFGQVEHFCYLNSITESSGINFYDSFHFYPHVGDKIVDRLNGESELNFGKTLTSKLK